MKIFYSIKVVVLYLQDEPIMENGIILNYYLNKSKNIFLLKMRMGVEVGGAHHGDLYRE